MKHCIHYYYGDGKGKSTMAIGMAMRAAGHRQSVCILQFLKGQLSGEVLSLVKMDHIDLLRGKPDLPFPAQMDAAQRDEVYLYHNQQLQTVLRALEEGRYQMVILDEVDCALCYDLVDVNLLEQLFAAVCGKAELVMTGHSANPMLMDKAHYVSEVKKIKHPFDQGEEARCGVEY